MAIREHWRRKAVRESESEEAGVEGAVNTHRCETVGGLGLGLDRTEGRNQITKNHQKNHAGC